jgi:hypothetical protein
MCKELDTFVVTTAKAGVQGVQNSFLIASPLGGRNELVHLERGEVFSGFCHFLQCYPFSS